MAEVRELLRKAREMRVMADEATSAVLSFRLRRKAHELEREAEAARGGDAREDGAEK